MSTPPMFAWGTALGGLPAVRDMTGAWKIFHGIPTDEQEYAYKSLLDFGRAPADEGWVYACVMRRAAYAQSVPWRVYVRESKALVPAEETNDSAGQDLQFLLDDVNPVNMSGSDLKAYTEAGLSAWGEGYWHKVRGRLGGPPQELYWLPAPAMTPKNGRTWIESYEYRPSGPTLDTETYAPKDIVAFRRINLNDPLRGLSPLSAAREHISVSRMIAVQTSATLRNWSIPAGAWVAPKGANIGEQDKRLIQRVLRAMRGPKAQGKVPVLPEGLDWKQIALSPKDAEWLAAGKLARMTVCAVLGVPLILVGDDEKVTTYGNFRDARKIMWQDTMIPELDWIADVLNSWLVPDFDPQRKRLVVAFDYSQIEALQEPLSDQITTWNSMVERGVVVPNEMRRKFRLGPDVAWGDEPVRAATLIPLGQQAPPTPPGTVITDDKIAETVRSVRGLYGSGPVKAWLAEPEQPLDTRPLLGGMVSDDARELLETGLRRRYNPEQLAAGVPHEGFAGLVSLNGRT